MNNFGPRIKMFYADNRIPIIILGCTLFASRKIVDKNFQCSDATYLSYLLSDYLRPKDNFDYNMIENVGIIKIKRNSQ